LAERLHDALDQGAGVCAEESGVFHVY
jgi:hypothetical protein